MYEKVSYLNARPRWGNVFKFALQAAQQSTNLQLLVQRLFKSVNCMRPGSVRKKLG